MDQVDFDYVGRNGITIYRRCFEKYLNARFVLKKPEAEWRKLVSKTETVFDYLVEEGNERGFDIDSILEIPASGGRTCFQAASKRSKAISKYIIERGIKVKSIDIRMVIPKFEYPDLAIPMMKKGINPHVISYTGKSRIDLNPSSFESEETIIGSISKINSLLHRGYKL